MAKVSAKIKSSTMPKLFMLLLGSKPKGRHTEQHDVFFGIGETVKDLIPQLKTFWPEAKDKLHVDGWREVNIVDGHRITVVQKQSGESSGEASQLFFINLGGYKQDVFDEPHYKMLTVQKDMAKAIQHAKTTTFYKHVQFPGATSHVDDKYGVDVDDFYEVSEILPADQKEKYQLNIAEDGSGEEDKINLGYFKLDKLQ